MLPPTETEIEKDISIAYSLNHLQVNMINWDTDSLTQEVLSEALNVQKIDLIIGGPPCQSYSILGKHQLGDRTNLFMQYKRILQIVAFRVFVFENVVGILSMDKGRLFQKVTAEFEAMCAYLHGDGKKEYFDNFGGICFHPPYCQTKLKCCLRCIQLFSGWLQSYILKICCTVIDTHNLSSS